jgi:hypothetical protein
VGFRAFDALVYELETEFEVIETFGFSFIFSIEIKKE